MVRHQTPAENTQTVTLGMMPQERHVQAPVDVAKEGLLAVIPPLRDVVRYADRHHASYARHAVMVPNHVAIVKG